MSDDKKTCSMCRRCEQHRHLPGRGICRAPVPFWVEDGQIVFAGDIRADECNCFEPPAEKVEEAPFA